MLWYLWMDSVVDLHSPRLGIRLFISLRLVTNQSWRVKPVLLFNPKIREKTDSYIYQLLFFKLQHLSHKRKIVSLFSTTPVQTISLLYTNQFRTLQSMALQLLKECSVQGSLMMIYSKERKKVSIFKKDFKQSLRIISILKCGVKSELVNLEKNNHFCPLK